MRWNINFEEGSGSVCQSLIWSYVQKWWNLKFQVGEGYQNLKFGLLFKNDEMPISGEGGVLVTCHFKENLNFGFEIVSRTPTIRIANLSGPSWNWELLTETLFWSQSGRQGVGYLTFQRKLVLQFSACKPPPPPPPSRNEYFSWKMLNSSG